MLGYRAGMAEKKKKDSMSKYLTVILAVIIVFAVGVYAYTNLVEPTSEDTPEDTPDDTTPPEEPPAETLLTVTVGGQSYNYTLAELQDFDAVTGQGGRRRQTSTISGPYTYTGVPVTTLLNAVNITSENYTIQAVASDGYTKEYSTPDVQGHITVYTESGNETGNVTMIIAYEEGGVLLNESTGGPLRIAFVDDEGAITDSSLWLRELVSITVLE